MASLTDRVTALHRTFAGDFAPYAAACLKIKTKSGALAPFHLNRSQRYLHQRLEAQRAKTGKVRALVLKGRQVGISTYIAGRFYWRGTFTRGYRTYILAHLDDASNNLFTLAKRFHDNCPEFFRPETGAANAKELSFPKLDGGYKVGTAGSQEIGRSDTIHLFHGSEMAFWPFAEKHAAGLQQAIAATPGTEDIRESTANGVGNAFHSLWKAAERGDSEFEAIFIPWFWHEEYQEAPPVDWHPPPAFEEYAAAYQLTPAQTYWAWKKNRDLAVVAGGGHGELNWKFRQEYPANADEAFQLSGVESFISAERVLRARKAKGIEPYGPIILGVDPARGGGDKTAIIDRQGRVMGRHIAVVLDYNDLMALAGEIVRCARSLSKHGLAKIVIDTTGLGAGLYDRLREQLGDLVMGVNFGSKAFDPNKYANRRAEMWDTMRQWFEDEAGVSIPDSDKMQGDLCAPARGKGATRFDSAGRLILEDKDHIRERLSFSPDIGDASALTFAVDMGMLPTPDDDPDSFAHLTRSSVTGY